MCEGAEVDGVGLIGDKGMEADGAGREVHVSCCIVENDGTRLS